MQNNGGSKGNVMKQTGKKKSCLKKNNWRFKNAYLHRLIDDDDREGVI